MKRFFKKLFKRGDFMTRADKAYYGHKFKTIFWSVFSMIIISWVGTNLVLCALTTNVHSGGDLIYEAPKDVYFISGPDFQTNYMTRYTTSITFDRYTDEINAKIAGVQGTEVVDGIMYYKVGNDLYFLSNDNIVANENCHSMFRNYGKFGSSGSSNYKGNLQSVVLNNFDTKNVINMGNLFLQAYNLKTIVGLEHFNTKNVTDMSGMFMACELLTEIDVSGFDTGNVTTMENMFEYCKSLTSINITNFDTRKVTDMRAMFNTVELIRELDLSSFDTSSLKMIGHMFSYNENLKTIYASSKFTTSHVSGGTIYDKYNTFAGCTSLVGGKGTKCSGIDYNDSGRQFDYPYARIDDPDNGKPGYFTEKPYCGK